MLHQLQQEQQLQQPIKLIQDLLYLCLDMVGVQVPGEHLLGTQQDQD